MLMVTKGESYFNIHWNLRKTEEDSRNLLHQLPFDDGAFKRVCGTTPSTARQHRLNFFIVSYFVTVLTVIS